MSIPGFQSLMLPVLRSMSDGEEHSLKEIVERLADDLKLSQEERNELLPSGQQPMFYNRVGWANTYLKKSGLVETTRRSHFRITERGKEVLRENPPYINMKFLERFPEYIEFRKKPGEPPIIQPPPDPGEERTPEEVLEDAYQKIRERLGARFNRTSAQ
jgi:restriction system protein